MEMPPLAIVGTGRMGRSVAERASALGWAVVATIGSDGNRDGAGISAATLRGARVAIEFTTPAAAAANVRALLAAGCAVVSGTTGWGAELETVREQVRSKGGALLHAPNFSIGAAILSVLAERASVLAARHPEFRPHIVETHHAAKLDAPSGTAAMLAEAMRPALGAAIPITSIRVGAVPGTHTILLDAPYEQLRLEHDVRDRRVFADGALAAAAWIAGRTGVFTMRDVVMTGEEGS